MLRTITLAGFGVLAACDQTSEQTEEIPSSGGQKPTTEQSTEAPATVIIAKLESIFIPTIDFEEVSLVEAMDFFRIRSLELDRAESAEFRGLSILVNTPVSDEMDPLGYSAQFQTIERLQATNISFHDAIVKCCRMANADAYVTSVGIVICQKDQAPFPNIKSETGEVWKKLTDGFED